MDPFDWQGRRDKDGHGVSWKLTNELGDVRYTAEDDFMKSDDEFIDAFKLPDGNYKFTMFGTRGGLLNRYRDVSYQLFDGNYKGIVKVSGFGKSKETNFCIKGTGRFDGPAPGTFASEVDIGDGVDEDGQCYKGNLFLNLKTDHYGKDTSWIVSNLLDSSEYPGIMYRGGNYVSYSQYNKKIKLKDGLYKFTMYDRYGDGLTKGEIKGFYELTDGRGKVIVTASKFGKSKETNICIKM